MDEQDKKLPAPEDFLLDEPLPEEEAVGPMPELMLDVCAEEEISTEEPVILCPELPEDAPEAAVEPELPGQDIGQEEPLLMEAALPQEETVAADEPLLLDKTLSPEEVYLTEAPLNLE